MTFDISALLSKVRAFETIASSILGSSEGAVQQRAYNAHAALAKVSRLSIIQADLLKQSVRCIESGVYRAAIVMAWAAVADILLKVCIKNAAAVRAVRSSWNLLDEVSLAETTGDHAVIEALRAVGVLTKGEMKTLHGMLHKRNECAHPSAYYPGANEALGYLDEALSKANDLTAKL